MLPYLRYNRFSIDLASGSRFSFSVLTVHQRAHMITVVKELNAGIKCGFAPIRVFRLNTEDPEVQGYDPQYSVGPLEDVKSSFSSAQKKLEIVSNQLRKTSQSSPFVIWMRCPWPSDGPKQEFPSGCDLAVDMVLDFGQDNWQDPDRIVLDSKSQTMDQHDDLANQFSDNFDQHTLLYKGKELELDYSSRHWITARNPRPQAIVTPEIVSQWKKGYLVCLEKALKQLKDKLNGRKIVLLVTAFDTFGWGGLCLNKLSKKIRNLIANACLGTSLPTTERLVSIMIANEFKKRDDWIWIDSAPGHLLGHLTTMGLMRPRHLDSIILNAQLEPVPSQIWRRIFSAELLIPIAFQNDEPVNTLSMTFEKEPCQYLRGGGWDWRDVRHMQPNSTLTDESVSRLLQTMQSTCCYVLTHFPGEGGTSAAVNLVKNLASTHPTLAVARNISLTEASIKVICEISGQLAALSTNKPVVVFLGDVNDYLLDFLNNNGRILYVACKRLAWRAPRKVFQSSTTPSGVKIQGIPLAVMTEEEVQGMKKMYFTQASIYHSTNMTGVKAFYPEGSCSVFDISFAAFFGKHLSADKFMEKLRDSLPNDIKHDLIRIGVVQQYSLRRLLRLEWLNSSDKIEAWMKTSKGYGATLIKADNCIQFCHRRLSELFLTASLQDVSSLEVVKDLLILLLDKDDTLLEEILLRRFSGEKFSTLVLKLLQHGGSGETYQMIKELADIASRTESKQRVHIYILLSRLGFKMKKQHAEIIIMIDEKELIEYARKAVELDNTGLALSNLGFLLYRQKNYSSAMNQLRESLKKNPKRWGTHILLIKVAIALDTHDVEVWASAVDSLYKLSVYRPWYCYKQNAAFSQLCNMVPSTIDLDPTRTTAWAKLVALGYNTKSTMAKQFVEQKDLEPSVQLALSIRGLCSYERPSGIQSFEQNVKAFPATAIRLPELYQVEGLHIVNHVQKTLLPKWLWCGACWMLVHDREFFKSGSSLPECHSIAVAAFGKLISGATVFRGALQSIQGQLYVHLGSMTQGVSPIQLEVGMMIDDVKEGPVLFCIGLAQALDIPKLVAWIIAESDLNKTH